MTELYPLLTVENVKYWYWEVEPHWSTIDIAKAIGCSDSTVQNFMRAHNISIRSISEANINRFNCPHKYEKFLKQRQSEDFRTHQSERILEIRKRPHIRSKYSKALRESRLYLLSDYQKILLFLLNSHDSFFLTDFCKIIELGRRKLDNALQGLFNRQLVSRVKAFNNNTLNPYKYHFKYSITQKGIDVLDFVLLKRSFEYKELLRDIKSGVNKMYRANPKFLNRVNIGENQLEILKILQKEGPKFLTDLTSIFQLPRHSIDSSLRRLCSRCFLKREKKVNPNNSKDRKKHFLYSLDDKGIKFLLQHGFR